MAVYGDTIRLKKPEVDIEGKISGMTQDFIGVAIPGKDIKSVTIQPGDQQAYPDIIAEAGKTTYPKDIETFKRVIN